MKCNHCIKGDLKFGHEFKNQTMLNTHIKHKHLEANDSPADPNLNDIGAGSPPTEEMGLCSDCGLEVQKGISDCPNCGSNFED